jgi:steroid delta-isomerase
MLEQTREQTERFQLIARWFEQLSPESLTKIESIYAKHARFVDPFNDLQGIESVRKVYAHMFESLDNPRFLVTRIASTGPLGFMTWTFSFSCRGRAQSIEGCTRFELDAEGLIILHLDYWDAAKQVYEQIPVLGSVLRMLRRKLSLPGSR